MSMLPYTAGFVLAVLVILFARSVGLDRDSRFYPGMLIIIASFYVLFAAIGGSTRAIIIESAVTAVFAIVAVIGFRYGPWIIAAAIAAHGLFDFIHGTLISNPGVPEWWPAFCATFDIAIGVGLSWLILQRKRVHA
jgi:hypothetical protein